MRILISIIVMTLFLSACKNESVLNEKAEKSSIVAKVPPMGWNSFDAYDCAITEDQFKANVDYLADSLKKFGWEYAVIDYIWFNPEAGSFPLPGKRLGHPNIRFRADGSAIVTIVMVKYGRVLPAIKKFPSAANGNGFKHIADYVHSKGLKFGIHIMRGIPRQAVFEKRPILGTNFTAADIAEKWDTCRWCNNMYGIDPTKPGSQESYNSIMNLYASWGVDFIKADDMMAENYHKGEIELIYKAIQQCGRPMVLSLSCGEAPISKAAHLKQFSNMWRISIDFWD